MSPLGSSRVRVVVTDTNILINLIHVGQLELLAKLPAYSFVVPEEVVNEVPIPIRPRRCRVRSLQAWSMSFS